MLTKRIIALFLACALTVSGCGSAANGNDSNTNDGTTESVSVSDSATASESVKEEEASNEAGVAYPDIDSEANLKSEEAEQERRVEAAESFQSLNNQELLRYVQDTVYTDLVKDLDSSEYFVENVEAIYISNEYIEELEYNSKENVFFGYTLSELDKQFQGTKYVFTLGEDGTTTVVPFEGYDDTYDKVLKNVAIGTGVILVSGVVEQEVIVNGIAFRLKVVDAPATGTEPGEYKHDKVISTSVFDAENNDVTKQFSILINPGKLTIRPNPEYCKLKDEKIDDYDVAIHNILNRMSGEKPSKSLDGIKKYSRKELEALYEDTKELIVSDGEILPFCDYLLEKKKEDSDLAILHNRIVEEIQNVVLLSEIEINDLKVAIGTISIRFGLDKSYIDQEIQKMPFIIL